VHQVGQDIAPGVVILAVRRDKNLLTQPPAETEFRLGDELVAFGTSAQLQQLEGAP
jgi:uncharacterized protein with PhoU and TrkA domain